MAHYGPETNVLSVLAYQVQDLGTRTTGGYPLDFAFHLSMTDWRTYVRENEKLQRFLDANDGDSWAIFHQSNDYGVSRTSAPVPPGEIFVRNSHLPASKLPIVNLKPSIQASWLVNSRIRGLGLQVNIRWISLFTLR
jgi:hypothetical protein